MMRCPKCQSGALDIRTASGVELVMIYLTKTRKFRCRGCNGEFRAPDRRRTPRDPREVYGAVRTS